MSLQKSTVTDEVVERRQRYAKSFKKKSLTVQSDKARCDVNNIMAKFRKTGLIDHIREHEGRYEDVSSAFDFQEAMNIVATAQQSFDQLPSEIRKRFDNNPAEFLDFVAKPDSGLELVKMGLAKARPISTEEPTTAPKTEPVKAPDAE